MKHNKHRISGFANLLSLAAALFLAFGPAVAPVLSASPRNHYIEICTAFGLVKKAVEGDFAMPGQKAPHGDHTDRPGHCLFCNLRQLALIPPQAPLPPLPSGALSPIAVPAETHPAGKQESLSYNPRAPPHLLT